MITVKRNLLKFKAAAQMDKLEQIANERFGANFEESAPTPRENGIIHDYLNDIIERQENIDRDVMQDHFLSLDIPFDIIKNYYLKRVVDMKTVGDVYEMLCTGGEGINNADKLIIMKAVNKYLHQTKKHVPSINTSMLFCDEPYLKLYANIVRGNKTHTVSIKDYDGKVKSFIITNSQIKKLYDLAKGIESGTYRDKYIDTTMTFYSNKEKTEGYCVNIFSNGVRADLKFGMFTVMVYDMNTKKIIGQTPVNRKLIASTVFFYNMCKYLALPKFNED